jgi:hypothetical protein
MSHHFLLFDLTADQREQLHIQNGTVNYQIIHNIRRGRNRIVVVFTTTYVISTNHH